MKTQKGTSVFLLILTIILLASCGNKLTRDKAGEIICEKFNFPGPVTENLTCGLAIVYSHGFSEKYSFLIDKNLISAKLVREDNSWGITNRIYNLEITPEGQKYVVGSPKNNGQEVNYNVRVADKVFIEVTGIMELEEKNAARVDFTWKYDNVTPFGEAFCVDYNNQNLTEEGKKRFYTGGSVFTESVVLVKYDDGWRIQE